MVALKVAIRENPRQSGYLSYSCYNFPRHNSAYMLFYARSDLNCTSCKKSEFPPLVKSTFLPEVWEENIHFYENKYTFDPDYFEFVWNCISLISNSPPKLGTHIQLSSYCEINWLQNLL